MPTHKSTKITAIVYVYSSVRHCFILEQKPRTVKAQAFRIPVTFDTNPDEQISKALVKRLGVNVSLCPAPMTHPMTPGIITTPFAVTYKSGKISWICLAFCEHDTLFKPTLIPYTLSGTNIPIREQTKTWCDYFNRLLT